MIHRRDAEGAENIMEGDMEYTSKKLSRLTGLDRHQIIHLVERGVITPLKDVRGRGKVRRYSEYNIRQLIAVKTLMDCKVAHREIADILGKWNDNIDGLITKAKEFYGLFCYLKGRIEKGENV